MLETDMKNRYISMVRKLASEPVAASFREFLLSFDGTNEKELHLFIANFISILIEDKDLKIRAEGYNKLVNSADLTASQIESIKRQFDALSKGELPTTPLTKHKDGK